MRQNTQSKDEYRPVRKTPIVAQRGFTLTELMVVVSLLGLALLLSVAPFQKFQRSIRLANEAQHFATALRTARSSAVMKNINAVFQFDTTNNSYFYFEDNDADGTHDATEYRMDTKELPPDVTITAHSFSAPRIVFEPKGNTMESGSITLTNVANATTTIRVSGGTGNVSVD